jgi:glycine cleavage system aminomethyltransferase T
MSLEFLSPSPGALARSSMEREAEAAGAQFEARDGWKVAVRYADEKLDAPVAFADSSHVGKLEVWGEHGLELGTAERRGGAWWCPMTPDRVLVLGGPRPTTQAAIDVTTTFAALTIVGPLARELFARFSAIDLRPEVTPVQGWRPGSVARTPGAVLREAEERYLMLFGAALGEYMWTTVADAAASLGGGPIGADALAPLEQELAHA